MTLTPHKLSSKLIAILVAYMLVALVAIGLTLLMSWRLEGGAAAVNDMGSLRMRAYRLALLLSHTSTHEGERGALVARTQTEMREFDTVLGNLERGDSSRPLVLPTDAGVQRQFQGLKREWQQVMQPAIVQVLGARAPGALLTEHRERTDRFVQRIDELVLSIENDLSGNIRLLRALQFSLIALSLVGTIALIMLMYLLIIRPVTGLEEGMRRMAGNDFDVRVPVESQDEFGAVAAGFNRMADHLQELYASLEQRVAEKTRSLEERNQELKRLIGREKEMAISEERNLLAQELHDSIAQALAFLNLQAQMLQESLDQGQLQQAHEELGRIREGIQESYDDVRELLVHFRTRVNQSDIHSAIATSLERFEGQTGIATSFTHSGEGPELAPETQLQVMHIVQEGLSNARKHSGARHVQVDMQRGAHYRFSVRDDGCGFDPQAQNSDLHVGLRIMRERAHRAGGTLQVNARPGAGTEVVLSVPLHRPQAG
jgi:nitrate/nitrite-specific signal transduction histidine kinase